MERKHEIEFGQEINDFITTNTKTKGFRRHLCVLEAKINAFMKKVYELVSLIGVRCYLGESRMRAQKSTTSLQTVYRTILVFVLAVVAFPRRIDAVF